MTLASSNGWLKKHRIESGVAQTLIVFFAATSFNLPRWFEYSYSYVFSLRVSKFVANGTKKMLSSLSTLSTVFASGW